MYPLKPVLAVLGLALVCNARLTLKQLSAVYLPYDYDTDGDALYALDAGATEQGIYDPFNSMVYTVGDRYLHVIDYSDVSRPSVVHHLRLSSTGNDIEQCGHMIGVAVDGNPGIIQLYNRFHQETGELPLIAEIPVGYTPDMLMFTNDCLTILVANEGEPYEESGYMTDPEGSVSVIHLDDSANATVDVISLNFTTFNARADDYLMRGVRWPYRGELGKNPNTFSQSLEPEYIAMNYDYSKAFISLQENNAIAVIDLTSDSILDIYPLGFKSWRNFLIDASDKDGGINFTAYDIQSIYQPDSIQYMEINATGYILTANEGANMEFSVDGNEWAEALRGADFVDGDLLSDTVSVALKKALGDDGQLGRLKFSTVDGRNPITNKTDRLYHYGGRSFSMFRADDLSLVYDSGDDIESKHAVYYPEMFNSDAIDDNLDNKPQDTFDTRSGDKGPEPESVQVAVIDGKPIIFVGNEKTSSIMIYSFEGDQVTPVFESIQRAGGTDESYKKLFQEKNVGDLDPEEIRFIKASDSPTDKPMLLVVGAASGTAAMYEVVDTLDPYPADGAQTVHLSMTTTTTVSVALMYVIHHNI